MARSAGHPAGHMFSAPIPGQSLAKKPGNSPWQAPPKFVKLNDACNYIFDKLTQPPMTRQILMFFKHGVPLEAIARICIFPGFSEGMWTPNLGLLMVKPVMYMLAGIAQRAGINPKITHADRSGFKDMVGFKAQMMTTADALPPVKEEDALMSKAPEQKVRGLLSPPTGSMGEP